MKNTDAYLLITLLIRGQPVPELLVEVLDLLDGTLFAGDARDLGLELDAGLVPILVACEQKHIILTRTKDVGVGSVGSPRRRVAAPMATEVDADQTNGVASEGHATERTGRSQAW